MAGCGIRFDMAQVSRQIEESISILNFFPPNRGVDFYFEFLPAKSGMNVVEVRTPKYDMKRMECTIIWGTTTTTCSMFFATFTSINNTKQNAALH